MFLPCLILIIGAPLVASDLPATYQPLSYNERLEPRSLDDISLVVVHATELPDLETARDYGERIHYSGSVTGNSGHFYIDRDGRIEQWIDLNRVAHHVAGHNRHSIGIELVNRGRFPHWLDSRHQRWQESVTDAQINALVRLLDQLENQLPSLRQIAGHDHLDQRRVEASDDPGIKVRRKVDPGPDFPWPEILKRSGLERLD